MEFGVDGDSEVVGNSNPVDDSKPLNESEIGVSSIGRIFLSGLE